MVAFANLDKETVGKAGRSFQSHLEVVVEANADFCE